MTKKARKRRQRKRKQARKRTTTTLAPWSGPTLALLDHLPFGWEKHVAQAIIWINEELDMQAPWHARLWHARAPVVRCRDLAPSPGDGTQLCVDDPARQDMCANGAAAACWRADRRQVVIREGYGPNPGVICHELMHALTGVPDHDGWQTEAPCPFNASRIRRA